MSNLRNWLYALRLRTLPLAASGILAACAITVKLGSTSYSIMLLALLTAISLQMMSNLANDLGDFDKGTDNANRIGPERSLQSGMLTRAQMKKGVLISALVSVILGLWLLWLGIGPDNAIVFFGFLLLGIASIVAAYKYTVGRSAYGYLGLGDIAVFLFFGLAAVVGGGYLFISGFHISLLYGGVALGALSTAVLNTNNMRDVENDRASDKITLPVRFGLKWAKRYHLVLLLLPYLALPFLVASLDCNWFYLPATTGPLAFLLGKKINGVKEYALFDPLLKPTALLAFAYSLMLLLAAFVS